MRDGPFYFLEWEEVGVGWGIFSLDLDKFFSEYAKLLIIKAVRRLIMVYHISWVTLSIYARAVFLFFFFFDYKFSIL